MKSRFRHSKFVVLISIISLALKPLCNRFDYSFFVYTIVLQIYSLESAGIAGGKTTIAIIEISMFFDGLAH